MSGLKSISFMELVELYKKKCELDLIKFNHEVRELEHKNETLKEQIINIDICIVGVICLNAFLFFKSKRLL